MDQIPWPANQVENGQQSLYATALVTFRFCIYLSVCMSVHHMFCCDDVLPLQSCHLNLNDPG